MMIYIDPWVEKASELLDAYQAAQQLGWVDERGDLGLEPGDRDRLGVARRVEGRLALQLALDGVRPRADLLDVAGLHLVDEERLVWHALPLFRSAGRERDHEVQHQEREHEPDEQPPAGDHGRLGRGRAPSTVGRRVHPPARWRLPGRGRWRRRGRALRGRVGGQTVHRSPLGSEAAWGGERL